MRDRLAEVTIDHAGEAIFWVDSRGRFHRVNQAACVMHGMTREELLGSTIWKVTGAYADEEWEEFWKTLRREKSMIKESHHVRKDGTRFPVEVLVSFVEVDGKEFCCAFVRGVYSIVNGLLPTVQGLDDGAGLIFPGTSHFETRLQVLIIE